MRIGGGIGLLFAASLLIAGLGAVLHGAGAQNPATGKEPAAAWLPTLGAAVREEYLGPAACAECHVAEAARQEGNHMAHAGVLPEESDILRAHPALAFRLKSFSYQIQREAGRFVYTVSNGSVKISEPIFFAFGFGSFGQTFILQHDDAYYESRVSYYTAFQNLDITIGHSSRVPATLEQAFGNRLSPGDATLCFSCHTTAAVNGKTFDPSRLIPGVTCEACHGPGARHVAAVKAGKSENSRIFNPGRLKPEALVDFCGECHRTQFQVISSGVRGKQIVRFQPYRLVNSRCWDPDDARIGCVSCHNPHAPLVRGAAPYDSKCLACHAVDRQSKPGRDRPGSACTVARRDCVKCHMPRVELAAGHAQFNDHYIRIARPGESFPD